MPRLSLTIETAAADKAATAARHVAALTKAFDAFIAEKRNTAWINNEGTGSIKGSHIYLRLTWRPQASKGRPPKGLDDINTIDVATVEIEEAIQGTGVMQQFLAHVEKKAFAHNPPLAVYIENSMNPALDHVAQKLSFRRTDEAFSVGTSWIKLPPARKQLFSRLRWHN